MDEKITYSKFLQIANLGDRSRSQDLYEEYLLSRFDDVNMFLANFRGEG